MLVVLFVCDREQGGGAHGCKTVWVKNLFPPALTGCNFRNIGDILMLQKENEALNEYIVIILTKSTYRPEAYVKQCRLRQKDLKAALQEEVVALFTPMRHSTGTF